MHDHFEQMEHSYSVTMSIRFASPKTWVLRACQVSGLLSKIRWSFCLTCSYWKHHLSKNSLLILKKVNFRIKLTSSIILTFLTMF